MTRSKAWMLVSFVLLLAGCQTSAPASVCDGWKRVPVTAAGAIKLAGDPDLRPTGEGVAGHNQFGQQNKCWQ